MKILIVDDNPIDTALLKRELESSLQTNFEIVEADSVISGLQATENKRFDVILLDYHLPEVNGIEMIIEIRSRANLGNTAIIVVSASEDTSIALSCIEAGAQDFLPKSNITVVQLYKAIIHSKKRFEMEQKMHDSYLAVKDMAEMDSLTGLLNRYSFDENLKFMLANSQRSNFSVALLCLDLDNFKHTNDTLGHDVGDKLLKAVVARVKLCLRSNDAFARLGGDEFSIILGNIHATREVSIIANRILNSFKKPFMINQKHVTASVSIGAAVFPSDASDNKELIKCADIAMYRAKQEGKNAVCFFEAQFQTEFKRRFMIQNQMSKIIQEQTFRLFFQPIFNTDSHTISGVEALLRWPNSAEFYTPDEFIPIAEESRQIIEIGKWVIRTAISQIVQWQCQYQSDLTIAINVSPKQLKDPELCTFLTSISKDHNVHPSSVILEITETALIENDEDTREVLEKLVSSGFNIALDDFGMGYSSLSHLTNFPITVVKLDKSMQLKTDDSIKKKNIFEAVALMLKRLELTVVAEGIETDTQLSQCQSLKIDKLQGYFLGMPLPSEKVEKLLAAQNET